MQTRLLKKVCELTFTESLLRSRHLHSEMTSLSLIQTYVCNFKQPFQEILFITYKDDSLMSERVREKRFYCIKGK